MTWMLELETGDPKETHSFIAYLKKNGVRDRYIKSEDTYTEYIKKLYEHHLTYEEVERKLEDYRGFKVYVSSAVQSRKRSRLSHEWYELFRKGK